MQRRLALATLVAASSTFGHCRRPDHDYDVLVYGGTASGVIAAIAAAGEGVRVALVEPGRHVGGMVSGGLGTTDAGNKAVIGGMALEYYQRAGKHYGETVSWKMEPHVADQLFRSWLEEVQVRVYLGKQLQRVEKQNRRITALLMTDGSRFTGRVFVDTTYEGDMLPGAGVRFTVGREGRSEYNEPLAGRLEHSTHHQFSVPISPYDAQQRLLPLICSGDSGAPGVGDRKVQAYNFRVCITDRQENMVSFPVPKSYNAGRFEILRRYLIAKGAELAQTRWWLGRDVLRIGAIPNGKFDLNNNGPISTDFIGGSWDYPEGSYKKREQIWRAHKEYTLELLHFLQSDPSVPLAIRDKVRRFGLARDEFADTDHWPPQLYVREARRMIGAYVMAQADVQTTTRKQDSVGMGSYQIDSHHVQRLASPAGAVINEGFIAAPVKPYQIPYRCLVPRPQECMNLLVPVCLSASHVAYCSIRMEPQYMILGQAAGTAAALAACSRAAVQEVDFQALQSRLVQRKQILQLPGSI